jgi:hypothetical protein
MRIREVKKRERRYGAEVEGEEGEQSICEQINLRKNEPIDNRTREQMGGYRTICLTDLNLNWSEQIPVKKVKYI